ncbi:HK97 family phage prohead protease [Peijinzhouia sedimentorum]
MAKTFVLNDESKTNIYGFRVKNEGIDLTRFNENPVMLAMHRDWDIAAIVGRWINLRVEGTKLLADAEFDMDDEAAAKVAGKVERGFLKACSMGFLWMEENFVKALDGIFELVKTELLEASLVVIPGNANSVRLYASPDVPLTTEQVKLAIGPIQKVEGAQAPASKQSQTKLQKSDMEKFKLSALALTALLSVGLTSQEDPDAINGAIQQLGADLKKAQEELKAAKLSLQQMKDAQLSQLQAAANDEVDALILAGRLDGSQKESMVKLAISQPDLYKSIVGNLPKPKGLSGSVIGSPEGGAAPKSLDDFQKLPLSQQLAFKTENPDAYKALFQ